MSKYSASIEAALQDSRQVHVPPQFWDDVLNPRELRDYDIPSMIKDLRQTNYRFVQAPTCLIATEKMAADFNFEFHDPKGIDWTKPINFKVFGLVGNRRMTALLTAAEDWAKYGMSEERAKEILEIGPKINVLVGLGEKDARDLAYDEGTHKGLSNYSISTEFIRRLKALDSKESLAWSMATSVCNSHLITKGGEHLAAIREAEGDLAQELEKRNAAIGNIFSWFDYALKLDRIMGGLYIPQVLSHIERHVERPSQKPSVPIVIRADRPNSVKLHSQLLAERKAAEDGKGKVSKVTALYWKKEGDDNSLTFTPVVEGEVSEKMKNLLIDMMQKTRNPGREKKSYPADIKKRAYESAQSGLGQALGALAADDLKASDKVAMIMELDEKVAEDEKLLAVFRKSTKVHQLFAKLVEAVKSGKIGDLNALLATGPSDEELIEVVKAKPEVVKAVTPKGKPQK